MPSRTMSPDQTYWIVNGLVKKMNEIIIDNALRKVVTVTASSAPYDFTIDKTNKMPM